MFTDILNMMKYEEYNHCRIEKQKLPKIIINNNENRVIVQYKNII